MTAQPRTMDMARNKWRGVLMAFGIPDSALRDKHGPCPLPGCGGKDRFRFDNKDGNGTWFCNSCGAGNGLDLLMRFKGWEFREAASAVDQRIGHIGEKDAPARPQISEAKRLDILRETWRLSQPVEPGDAVCRYLTARKLGDTVYPDALRFAPSCLSPDRNTYPTMLAIVSDKDGNPFTMHRTFLGDGCKAATDRPRALMPGILPPGSAIRLSAPKAEIGIAEGIETALAASRLYEVNVWAVLNTSMMEKWEPPKEAEEITIFADNDMKFGGQKAAYALAHRLALKGLDVIVKTPDGIGMDWADVLEARE